VLYIKHNNTHYAELDRMTVWRGELNEVHKKGRWRGPLSQAVSGVCQARRRRPERVETCSNKLERSQLRIDMASASSALPAF